jgi:hypothetical protein
MINFTKHKFIILLLFITLGIKLFSCLYLSCLSNCSKSEKPISILAQKSGDAPTYLDPIDNFIEKGSYFYGEGKNKTSFGRAPYYGSVYYIFRLFASPNLAYDLVALSQIIMESISILFLCFLSLKIISNQFSFWLTYVLMMLSLNLTVYSNYLLTESFSTSFLIIFCYYYYSYLTSKRNKYLIIAGIFLCFSTLLKPYFCLLYIPVGIGFLIEKPLKIRQTIIKICLFVSPLILLSAPYTLRNLINYHRFLPSSELYAGATYTKADFAYRNFVTSWGGSYIFWDKRSAGSYFQPSKDVHNEFHFPSYAISGGYNMNDIEKVKDMYIRYQQNPTPILEDSVYCEFNRLKNLFIKYHPFRYHFISPLIIFKQYIFHSGSYFLPINKDFPCYKSYQLLIKISQSILYYFTLFAGFTGLILILKSNKKTYMNLFIPILLLIMFPFVSKTTEARFFIVSYPFLIIGSVCIICIYFQNFNKSKLKPC